MSALLFLSYLECSCTSSGGFTTHLGVFHHSKWHDSLPYSISFIHPFILFILLCTTFHSILCLSLLFNFSFYIVFLYLAPCLNFAPHHHLHHTIVSLCPLEVNLHAYLTTWLSSCPVGIFFEFLTIFYLKQKLINKVQPIKCTILKSTHNNEGLGLS